MVIAVWVVAPMGLHGPYYSSYICKNIHFMAKIAGVTTKRDTKWRLSEITINAIKHPDVVGRLKEMGLVEKSQFEKDCEKGITVDEARELSINHLRSIWPK